MKKAILCSKLSDYNLQCGAKISLMQSTGYDKFDLIR
jgi:hypothetical protein